MKLFDCMGVRKNCSCQNNDRQSVVGLEESNILSAFNGDGGGAVISFLVSYTELSKRDGHKAAVTGCSSVVGVNLLMTLCSRSSEAYRTTSHCRAVVGEEIQERQSHYVALADLELAI